MFQDNRGDKVLAQSRPAGTSAVQAYSPSDNTRALIKRIIVVNTTGSAVGAYAYIDTDGTTFDETTAILWNESVAANHSISIEFEDYTELEAAGAIGVRHSTGNAINFTIIGREMDVQ